MKPKWLVEHFDDRNSTHLLIDEIIRQGYECEAIKYEPLQSGTINAFEDNGCVIVQASINLCLQIMSQKPNWIPGPWLTSNKYKCSEYYPYVGDLLFNDQYIMMPRSEVLRNIDRIYNWLGKSDSIFLRPDSGLKSFTGKVFERKNFNKDWKWVEEFTEKNSMIIASTPKNIEKEWRFVVADKNVITGSLYNTAGKFGCAQEYPREAFDLAQTIADIYNPDPMFTIDVCMGDDGQYYILEIGAFSCAGLYSCGMKTIVEHASYFAKKEWEAYNIINGGVFIPHA